MTEVVTQLSAALADRFVIVRELGSGGMATVYLAHDRKNDRDVAIKVLLPDLSASVGAERFSREIAIIGKLTHPHILTLYDSGEAAGFLYYVMPVVKGESLREWLDREKQLPIDAAIRITRDVAAALGYAHERGVVHRDIKPENILVAAGHAVVADFGVARAITEAGGERLTKTGLALGTPAYMSPEQASGIDVDGRSDVYSLACVLYEMLAGSAPFAGPTAQAIMARHSLDPAPRIRTVRDTVPATVERAVLKALAKVPADRFSTAQQFADALETASSPVQVEPDPRAVAVLDFTNVSRDASLDWLRGGIAETVTADLKKTNDVSVIGRERIQRAMAAPEVSGEGPDAIQVGRSVGARWVVSGGFQTAGDRMRITPRFVDTVSGEVVSAVKIDGSMSDLFSLQDQVVEALLDILDVKLSPTEAAELGRPETGQLQAYELYARGRQLVKEFGPQRFADARQHFEEAVALDPQYALAHAGLGHIDVFTYIRTTDPGDLERGIEHLQRALALDASLGEAFVWLTYAYVRQDRYEEAVAAGQRATALEPDYAMSHYMLAVAELVAGFAVRDWQGLVRAVQSLQRSVRVDADVQPAQMFLAWAYMLNGEYDRAALHVDRGVDIEERNAASEHKFVGARTVKALLDFRTNRLEAARSHFERSLDDLQVSQHMYRDVFVVLNRFGLGECAHREGRFDLAIQQFQLAIETAGASPNHLGMGYCLVRARLGLARAFHRLHMRREGADQFGQAATLFDERQGFDFHWIWEGCDAQVLSDMARYHALVGRWSDAATALAEAASAGWGDVPSLDSDPIFARYQTEPELTAVRQMVRNRGSLPADTPPPPPRFTEES